MHRPCPSLAILVFLLASLAARAQAQNALESPLDRPCADAEACYTKALSLAAGRSSAPRLREAESLLSTACREREYEACASLGDAYNFGLRPTAGDSAAEWVVRPDGKRAADLYEGACRIGHLASACYNLADAYYYGRGMSKHADSAAALYRLACETMHHASACNRLGVFYFFGWGGLKPDTARSFALFRAACEGNRSPGGCANLGWWYLEARPPWQAHADTARALPLFRQSCGEENAAVRSAFGCYQLARAYLLGFAVRFGVPADTAHAMRLLDRACRAGNSGCQVLADLLRDSAATNVPKDTARAEELYDQACAENESRACFMRAYLLIHHGHTRSAMDSARATTYYQRACSGDSPGGCNNLANLHWQLYAERHTPADAWRAIEEYRKACDEGDDRACTNLGLKYQDGDSIPHDDAKSAADLFEKGCATKDDRGCYRLGIAFEFGEGRTRSIQRAADEYRTACALGSGDGCTNLGNLMSRGWDGAPPRWDSATVMYVRGCGRASGRGCFLAAYQFRWSTGADTAARLEAALQLFRRACALDYRAGCAGAAQMYAAGVGVPATDTARADSLYHLACAGNAWDDADTCYQLGQYEHAAALYRASCDQGNASACSSIGYMYDEGQGVEQDRRRAADFYEAGCKGGNAYGCTHLGALYQVGMGRSRDLARARALYEEACGANDGTACLDLGLLYEYAVGTTRDLDSARVQYDRACALLTDRSLKATACARKSELANKR